MATSKQTVDDISDQQLCDLYRALLKPRLIEDRMLLLLRQNKVSKWFSGIGQEAISVGATAALQADEYIFTLHRNLGVFTTRDVPLVELFAQLQGKRDGFTHGRDRSFHFGIPQWHIVGMISHLGPQLALACGAGLAHVLRKEKKVALAFTGEGGTSEGDFHEALNVAAVWDLPVIFLIENNGYGLSTPTTEQFKCKQLADRAKGYGIRGLTIDGNDVAEVYRTVRGLAEDMRRKPAPVLLECMTFRMRGHEEASGIKYVPAQLIEEWSKRDPILRCEQLLLYRGAMTKEKMAQIREDLNAEIMAAIDVAFSGAEVEVDTARELADVYAPHVFVKTDPATDKTSSKRFVDGISDALRLAMRKHENLVIMGQDVAEYGGVFKITEGFVEEFGKARVRNTPICESAIVGAGLGLALEGFKSVVEMQFSDFVTCAFNQIVNNLAKVFYRWGQAADVVVRMPTGGGVGAGPFHSQSTEAWFAHVPGLKVVYPSTVYDAKGLLLAAIEDPNPVMFYEHKLLYRSLKEEVPDDYYTVEIGKARLVQEGSDATIVTYGLGVRWAQELSALRTDLSLSILDLRTLVPLDYQAIRDAVAKTGRVLVLHEATHTGGFGAEVAAYIAESCFANLDAPVMRCASLDTPLPFAIPLEENFMAKSRLNAKLDELLAY